MTATKLRPEQLASRCDPAALGFATTAELADLDGVIGQDRAREAVEFGVAMQRDGYHLYVMGPASSGKKAMVQHAIAAQLARDKATEPAIEAANESGNEAAGAATKRFARRADWVYVNNFERPHQPIALELPPGRGTRLRAGMKQFVIDLQTTIPALFESEEHNAQVERINADINQRGVNALQEVVSAAESQGVAMIRTPSGFTFAPQKDNEVLTPQQFEQLPEEEKQRLQKAIEGLQEQLVRVLRNSLKLRKEHSERMRALNRSTTQLAVDHAIDELKADYADLPRVLAYLDAVRADVIDNAQDFRRAPDEKNERSELGQLRRYLVNVLVDASGADGSPVVVADLPTYQNLVGRVDHIARFGTLLTDFSLIKPGQLHRANGGYLLIDAIKLLTQPFAWSALKRALLRREVRIESMAEMYGVVSTVQLEPEPIALNLKVVLFGDRELHHLLQQLDPEFDDLFRVAADLGDDLRRDAGTETELARVLATHARARGLLPLQVGSVARLLEHGARLAGDASRLSARVGQLIDLSVQADHTARAARRSEIAVADVGAAIDAQRRRASRLHEHVHDAIMRGTLLIDTAGSRIGQINALAVYQVGHELFGEPTRITATTRFGEGQLIDVQRETELGGAIHSKGVLILASFLATRYSRSAPYSIIASLVFEQTYSRVEGDSASLAELLALLSSIAQQPLVQSLAVTGSVDQLGRVQAIGAVNEKIEGFFDICAARGLDGSHGVIVPAANMQHLMLRDAVIGAVAAGRFAVHAVESVDDAVELLTGVPAGRAEPPWDEASVNGRIARRLRDYAALRGGEPRPGRRAPRPTAVRRAGKEK